MLDLNDGTVELSDETLKLTSIANNFFERSEIAQEIISKKASFLEKWATLIFFLILVILALTSWVIKYPDIIAAPAKVNSLNAPKPVISLLDGKLIKLNVKENQSVKKGDIIGLLEATANHYQILSLAANIDTSQQLLDQNAPEKLASYYKTNFNELGELQQSYQNFFQAYLNFENYITNGFYIKKKQMLQKDIFLLEKLRNNLESQKTLFENDLGLTQKTFDANEILQKEKVISDFTYREEESKLLAKKLSLPQINSSIINNESQQNDKKKEISELENSIKQQKLIFLQSLNTFKSQIIDWEKKYLLTAPLDGKIAFASFIQENQQVFINQPICFVNPDNSAYFVEITIPQTNFGKVSNGQLVLIKLNSYPFQEYGFLKGKINFISNISTDSGYIASVKLLNGLKTNYNKTIQYRDGLTAQAQIVTKDVRLLERFYYNIVTYLKD